MGDPEQAGSQFRQKWWARRASLARLMNECVSITSETRGEYIGVTPGVSFNAWGIIQVEDKMALIAGVPAQADRADIVMTEPSAYFNPDQFNGSDRPIPVEGTRITRLSIDGLPTYQVMAPPLIDTMGGILLRLSPI